jgi:ABC-2 type transport system ATP-binding protein
MPPLIETHELGKRFGTLAAVSGVSLTVEAGEVLALLGPNGAGKTTTTRMLASILAPTTGWARIVGLDTVAEATGVRRQVGMLTEHHGLYTRMRALEYLAFFGEVYRLPAEHARQRATELLERFGLGDAAPLRLGAYSKGMRQKLAMARALLHDPAVLLLDEPTSAMDPESARLVRESIRGLRSANRAIVVCTHNLPEAESLADRLAVIRKGRIVASGSPNDLKRTYLGDPVMELRVAGNLDGAARLLPAGAALSETGPNWLRFQSADPETVNPEVVRRMGAAGIRIVTLSEITRSLEEVYLSVMQSGSTQ